MNKEEIKEKLLCALRSNAKDLEYFPKVYSGCGSNFYGDYYQLDKDDVSIKLKSYFKYEIFEEEIIDVQKAPFFWQKGTVTKRIVDKRKRTEYKDYNIVFNTKVYKISKEEYDSILDKRNEHLELEKVMKERVQLSQLNKVCNEQ